MPEYARFCGHCGRPLKKEDVLRRITETDKNPESKTQGEVVTNGFKEKRPEKEELIGFRYQILEFLGEGGMGKVYRCLDTSLQREVAVKRLLPLSETARRGIELFLREAHLFSSLNHQNIVPIHDIAEDAQGHYIVSELIKGKTLQKLIYQKGLFHITEVREMAIQVGRGLAYAHHRGAIHRNITPANIMLTDDEIIKIADFGLAQIGTEKELFQFPYGQNSLSFMPPELTRNTGQIDHRVDIYALGALLCLMATGKPPKALSEHQFPDEIREILLKALKKNPEERFFTIEEMLKAFQQPGGVQRISNSEIERGVCPACGYKNDPEAIFCRKCGGGLFEECPRCHEEIRVKTRHCPNCGINVSNYIQEKHRNEEQQRLKKGKGRELHRIAHKKSGVWRWIITLILIVAGVAVWLIWDWYYYKSSIPILPGEEVITRSTAEYVVPAGLLDLGKGYLEYNGANYPLEVETEKGKINMVLVDSIESRLGGIQDARHPSPQLIAVLNKIKSIGLTAVTRPFYLGKYEVTQKQFQEVMGYNPSHFKGDDLPVESVHYQSAEAFCRKMGDDFRLPTRAEWVYAAEGGSESSNSMFSGGNQAWTSGWHKWNSGGKTHPVGQKNANELGLYDMSGNVSEWCREDIKTDQRVLAGGCFSSSRLDIQPTHHFTLAPGSEADNRCGFRLARNIDDKQ